MTNFGKYYQFNKPIGKLIWQHVLCAKQEAVTQDVERNEPFTTESAVEVRGFVQLPHREFALKTSRKLVF